MTIRIGSLVLCTFTCIMSASAFAGPSSYKHKDIAAGTCWQAEAAQVAGPIAVRFSGRVEQLATKGDSNRCAVQLVSIEIERKGKAQDASGCWIK